MKIMLHDLRGCVDCLYFAANGDVPVDRPNLPTDIENATGYPARCLVTSGNQEEEGSFSWSPCECCGSQLGGDRFKFAVIA